MPGADTHARRDRKSKDMRQLMGDGEMERRETHRERTRDREGEKMEMEVNRVV